MLMLFLAGVRKVIAPVSLLSIMRLEVNSTYALEAIEVMPPVDCRGCNCVWRHYRWNSTLLNETLVKKQHTLISFFVLHLNLLIARELSFNK